MSRNRDKDKEDDSNSGNGLLWAFGALAGIAAAGVTAYKYLNQNDSQPHGRHTSTNCRQNRPDPNCIVQTDRKVKQATPRTLPLNQPDPRNIVHVDYCDEVDKPPRYEDIIRHEPLGNSKPRNGENVPDESSGSLLADLSISDKQSIRGREILRITGAENYHQAYEKLIWDLAFYEVLGFHSSDDLLVLATKKYCVVYKLPKIDVKLMPQEFDKLLCNKTVIKAGVNPLGIANELKKEFNLTVNSTLDVNCLLDKKVDCRRDLISLAKQFLDLQINRETQLDPILNGVLKAIAGYDLFVCFHEMSRNESSDEKKAILYRHYLDKMAE